MTITVAESSTNAGLADHELTQLAAEVGVFSSERAVDQTGGLEVIEAVLSEETGQFEVLDAADPRACLIEDAQPKLTPWQRVKRFLQRVRDTLSSSLAWVASPVVENVRYRRAYRERAYQPRHAVEVRWFGVQQSTAQRTVAARRRAAPRPPQEPVLRNQPYDYELWQSHMASIIQNLRLHEELRRYEPTHGRRFVCS